MDRLIAEYGLAFVFANVLLEQLGLPIPAMPTLIVSGALVAEGGFSVAAVFGLAFVACMLGDAAWYLAGRLWGRRVMALLCRVSLSPDSCVRQTEFRFERWGRLTLVLSKFIPGLSTIAPPLSGAMRLGWPSFLLLNGLGVAIWAGAAIGAGMLFHAGIHQLIDRLEGLGTLALQAIGVLLAGYVALKWWERRRFYRMLRIARIGVQDLRSLIDRGARPVVVDVRSRVARETDPRYIPGALAMDIGEVDALLAELSPQSEIVFYCSCPNEATAAQVAKKLIGLGYTKVRPLHGGLDAWVAAGFEVERHG
jgi:membrane protein DedA with SNARE-associated domain/rhodanese-related sulfurtransferase